MKKNKRRKQEPVTFNTKELLNIWGKLLQDRKVNERKEPFPTFSKSEAEMLSWLLFWKTDEFRVWIIKKSDKRAVRELIQRREATRRGLPYKVNSSYLRRTKFFKEFIDSRFNAAEAARRCGYSWKYAKQIGYRIKKSLYSSPYW